jgi:hypothetical protein
MSTAPLDEVDRMISTVREAFQKAVAAEAAESACAA